MRPIVGGLLVLLLALPAGGDQDNARDGPSRARKQYDQLLQDYRDAMQTLQKTFREAQTPAARQQVMAQARNLPEQVAPKFLALARRYPKDQAAIDALTWVLQNSRNTARGGPRTRAMTMLRGQYVKSDKIGAACRALASSTDKASEAFLRSVLDSNPHKDMQGAACLSLAELLGKRAESLPAKQKAKTERDSEKLFERAVKKYGTVELASGGTVGDTAKKELFQLQHLAVGKTAADIEGEDQDGKKFKLSDYRGKVVLLDFWGNW